MCYHLAAKTTCFMKHFSPFQSAKMYLIFIIKNILQQICVMSNVLKFSHHQNMLKALSWDLSIHDVHHLLRQINISKWPTMERLQWRDIWLAGSKKQRGSKKLWHAVNQVRPLQQTAILQERKTKSVIMLGPLLDKLIKFTYFHVDAFGNIKAETQIFV